MSTMYRLFTYSGFNYNENKRRYYIDVHQRKDVVRDRNDRFLVDGFKAEHRCYRWVQIKESITIELEAKHSNFPLNCSYGFTNQVLLEQYREYHVDTHLSLTQFIEEKHTIFSGNLSVRFDTNERSMMLIRVMEDICDVLMIRGFQAREFDAGLGSLLPLSVITRVNMNRLGTNYKSEEDAKLIFNSVSKTDLTNDPTLRYFRAGVNKDDYWNSSHMKIKLEDALDCLVVIFPQFNFKFF